MRRLAPFALSLAGVLAACTATDAPAPAPADATAPVAEARPSGPDPTTPVAASNPTATDAPAPAPESATSVLAHPLPPGATLGTARELASGRERNQQAPAGSLRPRAGLRLSTVAPEIVARGYLVVGVDRSQNLLSYRDPTTGQLAGFEIDLAREIARDLLGDPARVEFRFVRGATNAEMLARGEVDAVIQSVSVTAPRQDQMSFSIPYLESSSRLLVAQGAQLNDLTVCAVRNSTSLDILAERAPDARVLATQYWSDCLVALQQRSADAIINDDAILTGLAAQDPTTRFVGEPLATHRYAVALAHPRDRDGAGDLVRLVNSSLERIRRDGTWHRLYRRWLADYLPATEPPAYEYRVKE